MDYIRYSDACNAYFNMRYGFVKKDNSGKSKAVAFFTKIHFLYEAIAIKNILLNTKYLIVSIIRKFTKLVMFPFKKAKKHFIKK
jgi:hypothetical protein